MGAAGPDWEAPQQPRRGGRLAVLGAGALVLAALGVSALAGDRDGDRDGGGLEVGGDDREAATGAPATPAPESPTAAPAPTSSPAAASTPRPAPRLAAPAGEPAGSWRTIAEAPIAVRREALAVWTGAEVVVWGGVTSEGEPLTDGAAYDPHRDRWREIAGAPRPSPRHFNEAAVWTGTEMVVLGPAEAMAYRPRGDAWRELASPPDGAWVWPSAGWVGGRLVVLGHAAHPEVDATAVAYDPEADAWEALPPPPLAGWEGSASAGLDGRLAVMGLVDAGESAQPALTVYDPAPDAWSEPDPAPVRERWFPRLVADPRSGLVLAAGGEGPAPGLAHAWTRTGWRDLPDVPDWLVRGRRQADAYWTGTALLAWNGLAPASGALLDVHRPDRGWEAIASSRLPARDGYVAVWTGDELVVWGGGTGFALHDDGAAFDPTGRSGAQHDGGPGDAGRLDGAWRRVAGAPFTRDNPSLDWTGDELLVWGGTQGIHAPSGSALDVAGDAWTPMERAPIAGRQNHLTAWTGTELLVWGGHDLDGRADGGAYHPGTDSWRELPPAPLGSSLGATGAWTGDELLVVAGGAEAGAAAYDPASDRWRRLRAPPPHGHRLGAAWTGEELVVVSDALNGTVVRYDPVDGVWRGGADRPELMPTVGVESAWTGEEVLLWGGGDETPSHAGWAYHPQRNGWRRLPDPWLGGTLNAAGSAWTGEHWVVLGRGEDGRPGLAAYDPAGDRWLALPRPRSSVLVTGPLAWTGTEVVAWSMFGEALAFRPGG